MSEDIKITREGNIYTIELKYGSPSIMNSILKTKLIRGASITEDYNMIKFPAKSVQLFPQFQQDLFIKQGRNQLTTIMATNMMRDLTKQVTYLMEEESRTIIGYTPEKVVVINDQTFAYLGSEFVADIGETDQQATICCPISTDDFFFSPEHFNINELPKQIHQKSTYFSMALMVIYGLLGEKEFYDDYIKNIEEYDRTKFLEILKNYPIYETKLFWVLSKCLDKEPNRRIILSQRFI